MKIIDLLVKISKGEEVPKEIMFDTDRYYLNNNNHYVRDCGDFIQRLDIEYNLVGCLNDEVEIVDNEEWKTIEKINKKMYEAIGTPVDEVLIDKINQIIDLINDMRDKE